MVTWSARRGYFFSFRLINIRDGLSFVIIASLLALLWSVSIAAYPQERAPMTCYDAAGQETSGDDWKECR